MSDVGIAPGGILEDSLSSGLCSSLEAGCCSVIGTTLSQPVPCTFPRACEDAANGEVALGETPC